MNIIAFQGAPGAFSHEAAKAFAKNLSGASDYCACQTFGEVFSKVAQSESNYGAIPLENSSIGSIVANYDLLWNFDAFIISEFFLPVHHHLIGLPGTKVEEIESVFSHPAALDQCRRIFAKHKTMSPRVHWDTSGSVAYVKETGNSRFAAIAGEPAARQYDMEILVRNVEDFEHNATRFGLISNAQANHPVPAFPCKLSCAVELSHKPGALAALLNGISETGANLTKIESRPMAETAWHYRFFLDAELPDVSIEDHIVSAIKAKSDSFKILGRYRCL